MFFTVKTTFLALAEDTIRELQQKSHGKEALLGLSNAKDSCSLMEGGLKFVCV